MMVKIRACGLSQKTFLIIGRGSRKVATFMALFAYTQPSVAFPVLSGRLTSTLVAHAISARHVECDLQLWRVFSGMTDTEVEDAVHCTGPSVGIRDAAVV